MNIQDFIRASIVQIANGVREANQELKENGAIVNPQNLVPNNGSSPHYGFISDTKEIARMVESIEFDIAVTTTESTEAGGGLSISVAAVGMNLGGRGSDSNTSISRLKFRLPIAWPLGE